jgi:hypothetical protein
LLRHGRFRRQRQLEYDLRDLRDLRDFDYFHDDDVHEWAGHRFSTESE